MLVLKPDEATGALTNTFAFFQRPISIPEFGKSTGYDYTRTKNPTRSSLEKTLAAIEHADYAFSYELRNERHCFGF
ncbi:cystathionine gamma-synthase [Streptococcus anginosus]|nr:cystathionine gamma-synthase [Streptococcus anginosus]